MVVRPPMTGDPQLDSFMDQVANELNTRTTGTTNVVTNTVQAGSRAVAVQTTVTSGTNQATLLLFQRTTLNEENGLTPPDPFMIDTRYSYTLQSLLSRDAAQNFTVDSGDPSDDTGTPAWGGWTPFIPDRDPLTKNDYVWFQSVNIADRQSFEFIDASDWSAVGLYTAPGLGSLRAVTSYEPTVNADQPSFDATITRLYLGEINITGQIPNNQICWLISEPDGTIAVDAEFTSQADLDTALSDSTYTDRNFQNSDESGGLPGARHVGYDTTFTEAEIFTSTTTDPDAAGEFAEISREIEIRVNIDNVVYI